MSIHCICFLQIRLLPRIFQYFFYFLSAISRLFTIKIKIICCLFQPLCFEEFGLVAILRNDVSVRVYGCDDDVKYHLRRS